MAGTSGKVQQSADEESEGISSDAHGLAILEALGLERRNEVSAHLGISQCNTIAVSLVLAASAI